MQNALYTYILDIYDLVWLRFMAYQPFSVVKSSLNKLVGTVSNTLATSFVWFGRFDFMAY